jgi:hypothetical protein
VFPIEVFMRLIRWFNYKYVKLSNWTLFYLLVWTVKSKKPVAWYRDLFHHFLILLPEDVAVIADKKVLRKVMKITFPYVNMSKTHEDIFMDEFYDYVQGKRTEMYRDLYEMNTELEEQAIEYRVKDVDRLYVKYDGIDLIESLRHNFQHDTYIPDVLKDEIDRKLLSVLAVSISVGWGCD